MGAMAVGGRSRVNRERDVVNTSFSIRSIDVENFTLFYSFIFPAMMAQLAYGKIAFIAGTALLTAKIALVLSAIIGLKKLVSSHGGGGHEVIYATGSEHHGSYGGGYGGGWQRAMEDVPTT